MTPEQRATTELLAISIDDRERQRLMIERVAAEDGRSLEFPLLSDPDHLVVARYGLLNQEDPRDRPIPHPTVLVIDRERVVRWKSIEIDYTVRPTNDDILGALAGL